MVGVSQDRANKCRHMADNHRTDTMAQGVLEGHLAFMDMLAHSTDDPEILLQVLILGTLVLVDSNTIALRHREVLGGLLIQVGLHPIQKEG